MNSSKNQESKTYRKGVIAYIVDGLGNILLSQSLSYGVNDWSFVGGGIEESESPEEALEREIFEEIGITKNTFQILLKSPSPLMYEFPTPIVKEDGTLINGQIKDQYIVLFKGDKSNIKPNLLEIREVKWVSIKDLPNYLHFPNQLENVISVINLTNNE